MFLSGLNTASLDLPLKECGNEGLRNGNQRTAASRGGLNAERLNVLNYWNNCNRRKRTPHAFSVRNFQHNFAELLRCFNAMLRRRGFAQRKDAVDDRFNLRD